MHGTGLADQSARSMVHGPDRTLRCGSGVARDIARKFDTAAFAGAINEAEKLGHQLGAFAADPTMALTLAKQHQPTCRYSVAMQPTAFGTESAVSRSWSARTSRPARPGGVLKEVSFVVQRQGVELEVDRSVHFGSDPVAGRAIIGVGFAFPHPAGIIKLTEAAA